MYQFYPSLVLGFHGCDKKIGEALLNQELDFKRSDNTYDWLGSGMYFWENTPKRAMSYALEVKENPQMGKIDVPYVIGAVINLGYCFNLLDHQNLKLLQAHYEVLKNIHDEQGIALPQNTLGPDRLLRKLDRAVIEFTHTMMNNDKDARPFDSARAAFFEGEMLYAEAGFTKKNHIQLCIRNPNCIKGFFKPRELSKDYIRV